MKPRANKHQVGLTMTTHSPLVLDLQMACDALVPSEAQLLLWLQAALPETHSASELTLRIVGRDESQELNHTYRGNNKPTNILSFPSDLPDYIDERYLGDLVICADVVATEAVEQHKTLDAHWAHMLVHGTLHLLGYDHIEDDEAEAMEVLETQILKSLGFSNPYEAL